MKILINGCFDLLHEGHKHIIMKALMWSCEGRVKVLMNTDSSIRKLKGEGRPIDSFEVRRAKIFEVVKSCKAFKWDRCDVEAFDSEEELAAKIDEFAPDMIIKGDDRPDTRDIVGHGKWPILILPRLEGYSTTALIEERGLVTCRGNCHGVGCGKEFPIEELTYLRTHWYTPPRGCCEGDYWSEGEGNFVCPKCGHLNRLYDRPEIEKLKRRFKDILDVYPD